MFTESAELYDLIYSGFKNYEAEATALTELLASIHPDCRTVLDVACGTGEHARLLAQHGFTVDGLDLNPEFVRIARRKHPAGRFIVADMSEFALRTRYDALICLFSSIGYLKTKERVEQALRCFRHHLRPGSVVLVEPWFAPGELQHGYRTQHTGEGPGVTVRRDSTTLIEGRVSRLLFEYTIQMRAGIRHSTEVHELGLFTVDEMLGLFAAAGLRARHVPGSLTGRGLYIAHAE